MSSRKIIKELKEITEKHLIEGLNELENSIGDFNFICETIDDLERNIDDYIWHHDISKDNFNPVGLVRELFISAIEECESFIIYTKKINKLAYDLSGENDGDLKDIKLFIEELQDKLDYETERDYCDYCIFTFRETVNKMYYRIKEL